MRDVPYVCRVLRPDPMRRPGRPDRGCQQ
jgi:hypothetical protein